MSSRPVTSGTVSHVFSPHLSMSAASVGSRPGSERRCCTTSRGPQAVESAGVRGHVVAGADQAIREAGAWVLLPETAELREAPPRHVLPDDALRAAERLSGEARDLSEHLVVLDARGDLPARAQQHAERVHGGLALGQDAAQARVLGAQLLVAGRAAAVPHGPAGCDGLRHLAPGTMCSEYRRAGVGALAGGDRRARTCEDAGQRSGSWSGDYRGLQNRLRGSDPVLGGFDSHVAPPASSGRIRPRRPGRGRHRTLDAPVSLGHRASSRASLRRRGRSRGPRRRSGPAR